MYRCSSYIGRQHRSHQPQTVYLLSPTCTTFHTAVHELGHVIGFYHEHTRVDRDGHITVIHSNIHPNLSHNFDVDNGDTLGLGYDYASIMHYHSRAFSIDRLRETIRAKDQNIIIGGARELSPLDILKANELYKCCK